MSAVATPETSTPWGPITLEEPPTGTAARVLDAAMARFADQGISATTMSQLAADVGISRVWLYRFFENRDAVVRGLLSREAHRFLLELADHVNPAQSATDIALSAFDYAVGTLRRHDVLQRVLQTEPEMAAIFVASGTGPLLRVLVDACSRPLSQVANMPRAEANAVVETLLRLVLSIVVNNDTAVDFDDRRQRRAYANRIIPKLIPRAEPEPR